MLVQQIHLSTLEKILYYNVPASGQNYNVQVTKHWLHEVHPIIYKKSFIYYVYYYHDSRKVLLSSMIVDQLSRH